MSNFFFICLLTVIPLYAQDRLETVVVSGDKNPQNYSFGDTSVLRNEDIKQSSSPFLGEILKNISSIVSIQNGGPGGRQSYFLRGTDSRQLAFMVDHLKVNDPSNNDRHFDSAFTLSADIEEVVVMKSSRPVLYGSDAIGGVVLLKTKKGPREGESPYSLISIGAGSFSTFQESLQHNWKSTKDRGTITLTHYKSMGLSRLNKKRTNARERDGTEIINIGSSSTHQWSGLESDLLIKYIHGMTEQDGYDNLGYNTDTNDRSYNDQYLLQQKTRKKTSIGAVQLRQGLNRHDRRILTKSLGEEVFSGNNIVNELTLVNQFNSFESTSGLSHEHESFHGSNIDKSFDLSSAYFHGRYEFQILTVHAGLRGDHHSRYGNFTSGAGGMNLKLGSLDFFVQYSQGTKAPSLYQLFAPASLGAPVGNKNLRPETNKATEVGFKLKGQSYDLVMTAFQNDLQSQFTYINGVGYRNQEHYIAQGVETNLTSYFTDSVRWQNSYTHQKFLSEDLPLRRPQNAFVSALFWTPIEKIELFWRERLVDAREDIDEVGNRVKLNPYQVSSAGGIYRQGSSEISLTIENIFNREYEDIYATTVMPLSFWMNLNYRF